jgi:hypothetical protein
MKLPGTSEGGELTQHQMAAMLVVGLVGAVVGTVVFLILLTIVIGLADGH